MPAGDSTTPMRLHVSGASGPPVAGSVHGPPSHDWPALTRRAALGLFAAGGLGFALVGPRGDRGAHPGRLVLDYWEKWTGDEGAAMRTVVDEFNASQSKIHVRYLITGTIQEKALIAISGGNPPDVIGMYAYTVPPYAEAGAVLPLDDLAPAHALSLDDYAAGMRQVMTHRGRWWATINTGGTMALYYNKRLFREAGLDPERPPRTIEEMSAAHERLVRKDGAGKLQRVGFLHKEPGWWSWFWGYHFGGALYDPAQDQYLADRPPTVRAYEWMQAHARGLGHVEVERFQSGFGPYGTDAQAFLTGKVAMVNQGPWLANQLVAYAPDLDYGVCPVPVASGLEDERAPVGLIDTDVLMIPSSAKHPEASMEFIAYTQRPQVVEFLATRHCKGSPMARVSDEFLAKHPNRGVRVHNAIAASPRAFVAPTTPVWVELKNVFDMAVDEMWKGVAPAATKLTAVQRQSTTILQNYARLQVRRGDGGAAHGAAVGGPGA